jgi:hypothetical protein
MSDLTRAIDALDRAVLERDQDLAGTLLDPEFAQVSVTPSPSSLSRDSWLHLLDDNRPDDYEVLERFIDLDVDTAAVLQQVRMRAIREGEPAAGSAVEIVTDIWRLRGGEWRIWRRHSTPAVVVRAAGPARPGSGDEAAEGLTENAADNPNKATVTEVAAVLAAMADAGHDPNTVSMAEMEEYVEAFRALKEEGGLGAD